MTKRCFWICLMICMVNGLYAQAPKWMDKARQAVFSVITYDAEGKILNSGNAFFVSDQGVALSDYALFRGADKAVAVTTQGVQMPVEYILGANELFDVIKFKVQVPKKVPFLLPVAAKLVEGSSICLLPYSTQKTKSFTGGTVQTVDKATGDYSYYTLKMALKEKMVSCPVMTSTGEVVGLAQKAMGQDTASICYAMDVHYAMDLKITPFSATDVALQGVHIRKALPDTEEQALVALYMASTQLSAERYMEMLDTFIAQYPHSADGYLRRATQILSMEATAGAMSRAERDMEQALQVATNKDEAYYQCAKLIYTYRLRVGAEAAGTWTFAKALEELQKAIAIQPLPLYRQLEGDLNYAEQKYDRALAAYEEVNRTNFASPATFYSAAKTKEVMEAPMEEVLVLMDSCVARFSTPYTVEAAPYLLERAQMRMSAGQARGAVSDYDAYYDAMKGQVNHLFYSYRAQAALKSRQYQRALDDCTKAVELNPGELTYRAELAVVNLRIGRNEEAISVLQEALKIDASYAEAYRLIGIAQIQLKQPKAACESFAKAKQLGDPNVDALIEKHCKK